MNEYLDVLTKYAVFEGRASRREYWMYVLFNSLVGAVLGFCEGLLRLNSMILLIYMFAVLTPSTAVSIRRMHDVNKSGWYLLVPIYGTILTFIAGDKGSNRFGPDSKEAVSSS